MYNVRLSLDLYGATTRTNLKKEEEEEGVVGCYICSHGQVSQFEWEQLPC